MYRDRYGSDEIFLLFAFDPNNRLLTELKKVKNPNFQDNLGISYLYLACQSHSLEAIKILLEKGADPNIVDNEGDSPVLGALASINEHNNEIFELLLKHGLDLDKQCYGKTLKEKIEEFRDDDLNRLIEKYYKK